MLVLLKLGVIVILYVWMIFNVLFYGSIFFGSFMVNWGVDYILIFKNYFNLFGNGMFDGVWFLFIIIMIYVGVVVLIIVLFGLLIVYVVVR